MSSALVKPLKPLEAFAKKALACVAALVLRRRRTRRAQLLGQLRGARHLLLVRLDNRVGEALLSTPLLTALARLPSPPTVDFLLHRKVTRVLEHHPLLRRALPFDDRALWLGPFAPGIRALRRARYDAIIHVGNWEVPSVTGAIVSRLIAPRTAVVGPAVWPVGQLADVAVTRLPSEPSEVRQRCHLLSPLGVDTRADAIAPLSFRSPRELDAIAPLLADLREARWAVVNPGGRLGERRIPASAFAAAARVLQRAGWSVLVTHGPGEEPLAREVCAQAAGARLAPATTLDELAAILQTAGLCVCNNTGPMHLSVATGTPTLAFFLRIPLERWGHSRPPHRMVDLTPFATTPTALQDQVEAAVTAFASSRSSGGAPEPRSAPTTV